jgi:hypothetical protein
MRRLFFLLMLFPLFVFAEDHSEKNNDKETQQEEKDDDKDEDEDEDDDEPYFQGTLLTFYSSNADPGTFSVQPYLAYTHFYGFFDDNSNVIPASSHQVLLNLFLDMGLTNYLDLSMTLSGAHNWTHSKSNNTLGDLTLFLGLQLMRDNRKTWEPDIRFLFGESFPTGDFDQSDVDFQGIDSIGVGCFQTFFVLTVGKNLYVIPGYPWSVNLNLLLVASTRAEVFGAGIWGGGPGTHGFVHPGLQYIANLGFEQSLSKHIAVGIDVRYEHQNESPFDAIAVDAPTAFNLAADRFSLAPCFEVNFNERFAIEGGCWFSVWGRNHYDFLSSIFTFFYLF